jgi:MarR family protein
VYTDCLHSIPRKAPPSLGWFGACHQSTVAAESSQHDSRNEDKIYAMTSWNFLTNHARVLLCIAHDPGVRLRDIAASLGITERSAHGIVTELTNAGYVVKHKDGRRNRYQIQAHLPLHEPGTQEIAIGEVLALLAGERYATGSQSGTADG